MSVNGRSLDLAFGVMDGMVAEMAPPAGHTPVSSSGSRAPAGPWFWLGLLLVSPVLLIVFLGDLLAAPFVSRRHASTLHWLLYMTARFVGPLVILGVCAGVLVQEIRARRSAEKGVNLEQRR